MQIAILTVYTSCSCLHIMFVCITPRVYATRLEAGIDAHADCGPDGLPIMFMPPQVADLRKQIEILTDRSKLEQTRIETRLQASQEERNHLRKQLERLQVPSCECGWGGVDIAGVCVCVCVCVCVSYLNIAGVCVYAYL